MAGITGAAGADRLRDTAGDDRLWGLGGDDRLLVSGGYDVAEGGAGLDTLAFAVGRGDGVRLWPGSPAGHGPGHASYHAPAGGGPSGVRFSGVEAFEWRDGWRLDLAPGADAVEAVRVYRYALGRDPGGFELARAVSRFGWGSATDGLEGAGALARELLGGAPGSPATAEQAGRAYAAILGRAPSGEELAAAGRVGADRLAADLLRSAEHDAAPTLALSGGAASADLEGLLAGRAYAALLGRAPDVAGLDAAAARMAATPNRWDPGWEGVVLARECDRLAGSAEFAARHGAAGPSDGAFVDLLYAGALGRAADAGGRAFWVGRLAPGEDTRGEVAAAVLLSEEGRPALDALAASGLDLF